MKPKIVLDTRTQITTGPDSGRYHVKIKASIVVIEDGEKAWKPRRAKTGVYMTEKEFTSMKKDRMPADIAEKKEIVNTFLRKAEDVCKIQGLTPDQFLQFVEGRGNFENVVGMFEYYINECLDENPETGEARNGNAMALQSALNFFVRYKGSNHISYAEITPQWLEDCKRWALTEQKDDKGNVIKKAVSPVTFYIHCRALRTIMNMAHDPFGKITKESIPFGHGKNKFKIPSSSKKKRKIKLELSTDTLIAQKNIILNHVSKHAAVNKYLKYWKASYFGNGSNMDDVLRWKIGDYNKENQTIFFERKKTVNTEEDNEPIMVLVGEELKAIINELGNRSLDPTEYIFPVLNKGMNSAERKKAVKDFIRLMNRRLKVAAEEMKLEIALSSNSARYLTSTILDRSGIPKSVIKDLLGHNSEAMQNHYVSPYLVDLRKSILKILAAS
jgi:integrase/recombinase XerD